MEPLARLMVSLLELAETELTLLKKGVVKLGLSLVMLIGAGVFGVIGLCWLLNGIFLWLEKLTNRPTAFAICGVVFLATAAILVVMALGSKKPAKTADAPAAPAAGGPSAGGPEGKNPMTPLPSASPPKKPAPGPNDATQAKLNFLAAAHAASPLRAVEKFPWTAVATTAALTMGTTAVLTSSFFGKASGGLFGGLFNHGLGLASQLLKSRWAGPLTQGLTQGVSSAMGGNPPPTAVG